MRIPGPYCSAENRAPEKAPFLGPTPHRTQLARPGVARSRMGDIYEANWQARRLFYLGQSQLVGSVGNFRTGLQRLIFTFTMARAPVAHAICSNQFPAGFSIADVEATLVTTISACYFLLGVCSSPSPATILALRMCPKCH